MSCHTRLGVEYGIPDKPPIMAAQDILTRAVRMGHEAENVPFFVADASDVFKGTIGIGFGCGFSLFITVFHDNLFAVFQLFQAIRVDEVISLPMGNGDLEDLALLAGIRERRVGLLHPDMDIAADELEAFVPQKRSRKQACLTENLEPVADADDQAALGRE